MDETERELQNELRRLGGRERDREWKKDSSRQAVFPNLESSRVFKILLNLLGYDIVVAYEDAPIVTWYDPRGL